MTASSDTLAHALRDLAAAYHQGGGTGAAAYKRAIEALSAYQDGQAASKPLWRRVTDVVDYQSLPSSRQFSLLFRTIAALIRSEWSGSDVAAWLTLEARRAEAGE